MTSYGLPSNTTEAIRQIFSRHEKIDKAVLYGSRAKGNYKTGSDIDLTLIGTSLNLSELFQIENELDDLLLPYKIDLSIFHQLDNPDLISHIQRKGVVFYEKQTAVPS